MFGREPDKCQSCGGKMKYVGKTIDGKKRYKCKNCGLVRE